MALLLALVSLAAGADLLLSQLHAVAQEFLERPQAAHAELLRSHYRATQAALWLGAVAVAALGAALMWSLLQVAVLGRLEQAARTLAADPLAADSAGSHRDEITQLLAALDDYRRALGQEQASRASQLEALQSLRGAADAVVAQLRESDRLALVGRVAMGMAHEVGSPLAIVGGYLERLQTLEQQQAPLADRLHCIDQADHALARIHAILSDFAEPGLPRSRIEDRPCDLVAVALRTLGQCEQHPRARRLTLDLQTQQPQHLADASASHIEQVLTNLIVNAADAMRGSGSSRGGRVDISLVRQGDWQELRVDDDGPGIPAAALEQVFDEFYSTKDRDDQASRGSGWGLGLAVSRRIIHGYGGMLTASASPLGGARMTVRLPVAAGQRRAARPSGPVEPLQACGGRFDRSV